MASVSQSTSGAVTKNCASGILQSHPARAGKGLVHPPDERGPPLHFLRLALVLERIDIGRTTWLEGVKSGLYPPPIQVSHRNRWISYEIDALQQAMIQGQGGDALRATVSKLVSLRKPSLTS